MTYRIYLSISCIFLYQNITQKVRCDLYMNTWSALYAVQNFFRCFLAMHFYAVSFRMIISLIAFYASSAALLTLPPFFSRSNTFSYYLSTQVTMGCITCHPHGRWWGCSRGKQGYLKTVAAVMTLLVFNFLLWDCNEWITLKKFCPVFHVKNGGATYTRMRLILE